MLRRLQQNAIFTQRIWYTDKATFTQRNRLNPQNKRCWAPEKRNPRRKFPVETQKRWKLLVWAGIIGDRIIAPIFFEGNLNGRRYSRFIENELPVLLEDNPIPINQMWWQQDGAPAHNTNVISRKLEEIFQDRIIATKGPVKWPARSPDLTSLDFWL